MRGNDHWVSLWVRGQRGTASVVCARRGFRSLQLDDVYGARSLRLMFGARYDEGDLHVTATVRQGSRLEEALTFAGSSDGIVPAGGVLRSDPLSVREAPLLITYAFYSECGCTSAFDLADFDAIKPMNYSTDLLGIDSPRVDLRPIVFGLCGIELLGSSLKGCVAFFGDSITEQGCFFRPALAFLESRGYAALNLGVWGNRLLRGLSGPLRGALFAKQLPLQEQAFGAPAIERVSADVLGCSGLCCAVIELGVNDLYIPGTTRGDISELPDVEALASGYETLARVIDESCGRLPIVWLSIPPFEPETFEDDVRKELRIAANERLALWVSSRKALGDKFVSLEKALADDAGHPNPSMFREDLLHPNEAGGEAVFAQIKPELEGIGGRPCCESHYTH